MAKTGILLRTGCATVMKSHPPKPGELVFLKDTGQHAWIDPNGDMVIAFLDGRGRDNNHVLKGSDNPDPIKGYDGDKYLQTAEGSDTGIYTEWTKKGKIWEKIRFYRILNKDPLATEFSEDPDGTIYYVV